jgi:hypothetical protein
MRSEAMTNKSDTAKIRQTVGMSGEQISRVEQFRDSWVGPSRLSIADVIRYFFDRGAEAIEAGTAAPTISLPVLARLQCGEPTELREALEVGDGQKCQIFDPTILALCTESAFVIHARGWSMRDGSLPDSISDDDRLLMVPLDEFPGGLRRGMIVMVGLEMVNGDHTCTLKEWTGEKLKANNAEFKAVEFGDDVSRATALAVCRARLPKVFL